MNNYVFGKFIEKVRNRGEIKFVTIKKRNELVSEPNYHATKLLAVYLGLSFLEICKIIVHNYWCD